MKVKTISKHFYESDNNGSFPIPFNGEFRTETLTVSEDGLTAKLGVVVHDDDCQDPFNDDDPEGSQFYQFNRSRKHDTDKDVIRVNFRSIIRANPGRVFTLDERGRDGEFAILAGPFTVADTKAKRDDESPAEQALDSADGYYIAPDDTPDPKAYTESALNEYNQWCIGECFGVCVWEYKKVGEQWELVDRENEVWGFIGEEYAETELEERMEALEEFDKANA